jgi:hypothetical protein
LHDNGHDVLVDDDYDRVYGPALSGAA